jgi:hypothetical protein
LRRVWGIEEVIKDQKSEDTKEVNSKVMKVKIKMLRFPRSVWDEEEEAQAEAIKLVQQQIQKEAEERAQGESQSSSTRREDFRIPEESNRQSQEEPSVLNFQEVHEKAQRERIEEVDKIGQTIQKNIDDYRRKLGNKPIVPDKDCALAMTHLRNLEVQRSSIWKRMYQAELENTDWTLKNSMKIASIQKQNKH